MIRALLFDAAGTLIEPAEPVADVYARHFAEAGWAVPSRAIRGAFAEAFGNASVPDYGGHPDGDAAERAWWREVVFGTLRACGIDPFADEQGADRCFERLFHHYAAPGAWRVFPEVVEVLDAAARAGLATGVVSNFDRRLHGILDGLGLSFGFVLTSADAGSRKPDTAIFREALARLGMEASEVWHAGDSAVADGEGAKLLGIEPYIVDRPARDLRGFLAAALAEERK